MRTKEEVMKGLEDHTSRIERATVEMLADIRDILQEQNKPKQLHHEFNHDIKEAFKFTEETNDLQTR